MILIKGSENNTCYLYANELSKPMLSYKFDDANTAKKDEGMNDFVSAVCWSNVRNLSYYIFRNSRSKNFDFIKMKLILDFMFPYHLKYK